MAKYAHSVTISRDGAARDMSPLVERRRIATSGSSRFVCSLVYFPLLHLAAHVLLPRASQVAFLLRCQFKSPFPKCVWCLSCDLRLFGNPAVVSVQACYGLFSSL